MLRTIGTKPRSEPGDLVGLLLACHERIREFVARALAIARRTDVPDGEVVEAVVQVARYFREALPLHVADEEESILPRVRGVGSEVQDALDRMHREHEEHTALLAALLASCDEVRRAPADPDARAALGATARALERSFAEHLALEEAVIFPALRDHLSDQEKDAILRELRARRAR